MKRLVPGTCCNIGGILDEDSGDVKTKAEEMAQILTEYWQSIFRKKAIDREMLDKWLDRMSQKVPFS
eukprot:7976351-Karenia_brevis.AAC.1